MSVFPVRLARLLRAAGHDCVHVCDGGLAGQPDEQLQPRSARVRAQYPGAVGADLAATATAGVRRRRARQAAEASRRCQH
jgi:hypothetical protein